MPYPTKSKFPFAISFKSSQATFEEAVHLHGVEKGYQRLKEANTQLKIDLECAKKEVFQARDEIQELKNDAERYANKVGAIRKQVDEVVTQYTTSKHTSIARIVRLLKAAL
jgi:predicted  nucleic acid-binding Zn-ribbon protein